MGRINYVCEFGFVHETAKCRCMDSHTTKRQVECDRVEEHAGKDIAEAKQGEKVLKALRERMEETVDSFFGAIIMPVVKESLLDNLERDVSEWLIESVEVLKTKE